MVYHYELIFKVPYSVEIPIEHGTTEYNSMKLADALAQETVKNITIEDLSHCMGEDYIAPCEIILKGVTNE